LLFPLFRKNRKENLKAKIWDGDTAVKFANWAEAANIENVKAFLMSAGKK
jgi:hypothetical protein